MSTIRLRLDNTPTASFDALYQINKTDGIKHIDWTLHGGNVIRTNWEGKLYIVRPKPTWYKFTPHTTKGWLFVLDFLLAHVKW